MSAIDERVKLAIEKMLASTDQISDIHDDDGEFYFRFRNKYTWSITKRDNRSTTYFLYLYPEWNLTSPQLAERFGVGDVEEIKVAPFTEFSKTDDGQKLLTDLYAVLRHKYLNVDKVLDDILDEDL